MKFSALFFCLLMAVACSSNTPKSESKEDVNSFKPKYVQVFHKSRQGKLTPVDVPGMTSAEFIDHRTGKTYRRKGWLDATKINRREGRELAKLTLTQLAERLKNASARETTLIAQELVARDGSSLPLLASLLRDKDPAEFAKNQGFYWYENKDDIEDVEIRTFVAYGMQQLSGVGPLGVKLSLTKDRVFFATKETYAIKKDELAAEWLMWWAANNKDYTK